MLRVPILSVPLYELCSPTNSCRRWQLLDNKDHIYYLSQWLVFWIYRAPRTNLSPGLLALRVTLGDGCWLWLCLWAGLESSRPWRLGVVTSRWWRCTTGDSASSGVCTRPSSVDSETWEDDSCSNTTVCTERCFDFLLDGRLNDVLDTWDESVGELVEQILLALKITK